MILIGHPVTEYGLVIDCDLNGCKERHIEHLERVYREGTEYPERQTINGHKCRVMQRVITMWIEAGATHSGVEVDAS